ncbi:MAG: hypothetical protein GX057_02610 [Clostridiales bacterium]|nr:hypothetical protein [Clostridiales bacterium]
MPDNEKQIIPPEIKRRGGREETRKLKRIILCCFAAMLLFVILYFSAAPLINMIAKMLEERDKDVYNPTRQTIIFHTPDYNENIYDDEYYMGLDRSIYYRELDTGVTVAIEAEDYDSYDESVRFMVDFVNYIIAGDAESYNACFEEAYFEVEGNDEKEAFTMQKLYNILITKISETKDGYLFTLEYMIKDNNGTFRTDIGSDASRKQYITLTDKTGKLLIEKIEYATMK